ncbi:MAG: 2,3-cyclic 3-phosphodiesterase [Sphingomonadales bacterium]|jgi:2'-5' RNA ligase|nr:2,3-cyclic 3-phosphodiesterase [Sphingomonadales bacterium]
MHRLFVAIRPPPAIRSLLLATMGGVRGARWQSDDQIHLTLRFIGEVDRHRAEDVHAALGAIHHPAFEAAVSGIGMFDRRGQPDVIWASVVPHEPLKALHRKIDQAIVRIGVEPDRRTYFPHITLARLNRSAGTPAGYLAEQGGLATPPFAVDAFTLFESRLTAEGAVYSTVERYPLG